MATFPQDGDQSDQLIHVADERLYRLKHTNHKSRADLSSPPAAQTVVSPQPSAPEPIPISSRPAEKIASEFDVAILAAAQSITNQTPSVTSPQATYAVQRKAERVSMAGTNAYAASAKKKYDAPVS